LVSEVSVFEVRRIEFHRGFPYRIRRFTSKKQKGFKGVCIFIYWCIEVVESRKCVCGSNHIVKLGFVPTRQGKKQRYRCQECGRTFY